MTATAEAPSTNHRGLDLTSLAEILNDQQTRKLDLIVPGNKLRVADGSLVITGQDDVTELSERGVDTYSPNGRYGITPQFEDDVAAKLGVHPTTLRSLRTSSPDRFDLYDHLVNGLFAGRKPKARRATDAEIEDLATTENDRMYFDEDQQQWWFVERQPVPGEQRNFMARLFRSDATGRGIARALLSDQFAPLDNLDAVTAVFEGLQMGGIDPSTLRVTGDLSETRMYLHVDAPQIATLAPTLLKGYRSPFGDAATWGGRKTRGYSLEERRAIGEAFLDRGRQAGRDYASELGRGEVGAHNIFAPEDMPIMFAGFDLANSETGDGRWSLTPRITVLECSNGYRFNVGGEEEGVFKRNHLGGRKRVGQVAWSQETQSKELAFATSQTADIVRLVLSQEFLQSKVDGIEAKAGKMIRSDDAEKKIEVISQKLKWTQSQREGIWNHFLRGGQFTAGGVAQAVTSYSQMVDDVEAAFDLDATAIHALELAAV